VRRRAERTDEDLGNVDDERANQGCCVGVEDDGSSGLDASKRRVQRGDVARNDDGIVRDALGREESIADDPEGSQSDKKESEEPQGTFASSRGHCRSLSSRRAASPE
jgi:hypothetical protein